MKLHITNAGRQAEREALASGRKLHIKEIHVDSRYFPDDQDPATLTAVQLNPVDQNNKPARYPVSGQAINGKVLVIWKLPASSGGYDVNGLGFVLEDGTLWGYQRAAIGFKPDPTDGSFFEPHGTATHQTSASEHFTVELATDAFHASHDDVQHYIREYHKHLTPILRQIEGSVGRVRVYMSLDDVDEGYLPIRGQTLQKSDYPDYFAHMGVTSNTLRLPDWSTHPYLRQYSDAYAAGRQLKQEIQSHNHGLTINDAGGHTPQAYPIDLGTRSGNFDLNGRFWTNTTGNHGHGIEIHGNGGHSHSRGNMNITGRLLIDDTVAQYINGAFTDGGYANYDAKSNGGNGRWANFNAASAWSGRTSSDGHHGHGATLHANGNHNHYVDVNFGTRSVSIALGSYTVRLHAVPHHKHTGSVQAFGGAETRPNSTVVVYAVKVKYITQL